MTEPRSPRLAQALSDRDAPCPECGYNLRGVQAVFCPECGGVIPAPVEGSTAVMPAGRRSPGAIGWWIRANSVIGLVVVAASAARYATRPATPTAAPIATACIGAALMAGIPLVLQFTLLIRGRLLHGIRSRARGAGAWVAVLGTLFLLAAVFRLV